MMLATVVGKADASVKSAGLQGRKILVVRGLDPSGEPEGPLLMAIDAVGAGPGDAVAVASGGAALASAGFAGTPCDAVVVAILDHVFVGDREIIPYRRTSK
jgi:microcompartment protein CcmK/EutM